MLSVVEPFGHFIIAALESCRQREVQALILLVDISDCTCLRVKDDLSVVKEDHLDNLVAQSEDDSVLGSHPLLHQNRVLSILNNLRFILFHIALKITLEVLHQSDFLLKLVRVITQGEGFDLLLTI